MFSEILGLFGAFEFFSEAASTEARRRYLLQRAHELQDFFQHVQTHPDLTLPDTPEGREAYLALKQKYDPEGRFKDLFTKCIRAG